jgi:acetyl-CoA carboxylase biotin carboxyl carrier protein
VASNLLMDKDSLFELMDKFEKSEMSELTLKVEGQLIKMKKGADQVMSPMHFATSGSTPSAPHTTAITAADSTVSATDGETILAPLVGTFYRTPGPDSPAFVEEGSKVKAGDTLCILEAMKIMNELEAEFDCEILEILHESGTLAEYGTPLFKVKRL